VTDEYEQEIAEEYGRDSDIYRVRVLGEFPKADLDTVIPIDYVESAQKRDIVVPKGLPVLWGVDVARFGDDSTALVMRNSLAVEPKIEEWQYADTMQTAGRVKARYDACLPSERPECILVDVIGLGAGVVDRLRELSLPVRGVNVSESASANEKYLNLRAELWFLAREWLASKDHKLPMCAGGCYKGCLHQKLAGELVSPRYQYTSSGKLQVESKAAMKKRGVPSPNIADAFIMTFAVDIAALIHGSKSGGYSHNWNKPIKRHRAIV
jgi:phage terminase large subunit